MLVQIDYQLHFDTPFHFGTGVTAGMIDRTVIRNAGNMLYVPASTLKGILREHCEHLSRFYLPDTQANRIISPHDAYSALAEFGMAPTLITRIFGSRFYADGLRFDDAKQSTDTQTMYSHMQTNVSTQVRIDRLTSTAADEALYTSEFGSRQMLFEGTIKGRLHCTPIEDPVITVQNATTPKPSYSLLLLLAGILMIEQLGGNKSTGKGQCRCVITQVHLDGYPCIEQQWHSWIEHLDVLSNYAEMESAGQS